MKRFFSKNGLWVLSAIAIFVVVLSIMSSIGNGGSFLRGVFGAIAQPFRAAGTAINHWVEDVGDHFDSIEELQNENEALRRQIAQLEKDVLQGQADSAENQRLRTLLELSQKRSDLKLESATIIAYATSNWESGFTVNKGSNQDIALGDCAVDAYGNLVGVVTDLGASWCTVTTILDPSSHIGSMVFRTESPVVSEGDLSLLSQGRLRLSYLEESDKLINGDLIVTSGLGGYYPAGLLLATVEELRTDDSGMVRYAILTPKADLSLLTELFLVTEFDVVE